MNVGMRATIDGLFTLNKPLLDSGALSVAIVVAHSSPRLSLLLFSVCAVWQRRGGSLPPKDEACRRENLEVTCAKPH